MSAVLETSRSEPPRGLSRLVPRTSDGASLGRGEPWEQNAWITTDPLRFYVDMDGHGFSVLDELEN